MKVNFSCIIQFLMAMGIGILFPLTGTGQVDFNYSEHKIIRHGIHVSPILISNKGVAIGAGYSQPITPKMMAHITAGYIFDSYLNLEATLASGLQLIPSVVFFPDKTPNYKGILIGLEVPVLVYQIKQNHWVRQITTGDFETFVYEKYERARADAFQIGAGLKFGLRTHKLNKTFFWQPTVTAGILHRSLRNYTEINEPQTMIDDIIIFSPIDHLGNEFMLKQSTGWGPYVGLEVAFGLYRYKPETVKVLEF